MPWLSFYLSLSHTHTPPRRHWYRNTIWSIWPGYPPGSAQPFYSTAQIRKHPFIQMFGVAQKILCASWQWISAFDYDRANKRLPSLISSHVQLIPSSYNSIRSMSIIARNAGAPTSFDMTCCFMQCRRNGCEHNIAHILLNIWKYKNNFDRSYPFTVRSFGWLVSWHFHFCTVYVHALVRS